ncbi:MAG: chorismate synthase [Acidobacteria bacterium]|nr:MAG: chorismate synthase [Acidobacteriota bacterium]
MLRFLTAGESHGPALVAILDGMPGGLRLRTEFINRELKRRMGGYGRGGRMKIESDEVKLLAGVRFGTTLGSPIALIIENRDWSNWKAAMAVEGPPPPAAVARRVTRPRPGHADLAGALKVNSHDARNILERASARETAARVAVGAICRTLLANFGIEIASHTTSVGGAAAPEDRQESWERITACEASPLRCADPKLERRMMREIDAASKQGDSVGGSFQVAARGVPPGLGSHRQWDLRLAGLVARALLSIPSVKGAEVGSGFANARARGSSVHDEIFYDPKRRAFYRKTNRAGGIEGGMTNGEEIRARAFVKPLSTLPTSLQSVDLVSKEAFEAAVERTDTTAIAAAGVIGEAMLAIVVADAFLSKFGGDSLGEVKRNYRGYLKQLRSF